MYGGAGGLVASLVGAAERIRRPIAARSIASATSNRKKTVIVPPIFPVSDDCAGCDRSTFGNHDDAAADVIPVAVGMFDATLVDQVDAVADSRVLVDDHA